MNNYPLPVYLNQRYVFDVLAMMEDGFSQVETIKSTGSETEASGRKLSADIGSKNVFAFLGISLGGARTTKSETKGEFESSREKVHTPNSLFGKLRAQLLSEKQVKIDDFSEAAVGDMVEFTSTIQSNSLVSTIENFKAMLNMVVAFQDPKAKAKAEPGSVTQNRKMLEQFDAVLEALNSAATIDVVGRAGETNVLLTLDRNFIADATLGDITGGEFTILGKVTKTARSGERGVNLLRRTGFSMLAAEKINELQAALKLAESGGLEIPPLNVVVETPLIQVLPIAIFA